MTSTYFGTRLRQLRKGRNMTQKELANRLGTSAAAVSRWLGGGHNFTLSTLAKISTELGMPLISVSR